MRTGGTARSNQEKKDDISPIVSRRRWHRRADAVAWPSRKPVCRAASAGSRRSKGITEYRLANGLRLLVFPDPSKSTITVNVTYLVGSRQEGAGEGGMAHLLEHMVFKGSPKHLNIPQELTEHGARPNGSTVLRPHQLLRDVPGHRREPALGARSRIRPDGELLHQEGGSRQGIHGRAQRVRARREQPAQRDLSAHPGRRVSGAQLRPAGDRQPVRCRAACRSTACRRSIASTTNPTTPC